jgi:hypothetical protein
MPPLDTFDGAAGVRVASTQYRGRGLLAARAFKAGECILLERCIHATVLYAERAHAMIATTARL